MWQNLHILNLKYFNKCQNVTFQKTLIVTIINNFSVSAVSIPNSFQFFLITNHDKYIFTYITKKCFFVRQSCENYWTYWHGTLTIRCKIACRWSKATFYFFFGFHIPFPILLLINFHSYIFPPIKTKDTHNTVAMEIDVVICF